MTSHELVIRLGRPFDVQTDRGFFVTDVREITVPFANRQSAEAALREVTVSVRAVHDAGAEDYRTVVAGEVVQTQEGAEFTEAIRDAVKAIERP